MGTRTSTTLFVEFGPLTADQEAFVDLHTLRAVGTEPSPTAAGDGVVIEFWLPIGETADGLYDDIRGWAIGNGLPIRGIIDN